MCRTWRWCFYINLPIGALTLTTTLLFFRFDVPKKPGGPLLDQLKRLDPLGLLFFGPSMICLVIAFQWAGSKYEWSNPKIIGLMVTFGVTLLIFIAIEARMPMTAIAPGSVVANRSMAGGLTFMFTSAGAMMTIIYYLSLWFQTVRGDSPMDAGIHSIPLILALVITGILAAGLTQRIGYYVPVMLLGPIPASVGAGMLSTLTSGAPTSHWMGYQVLYGVGLGFAFQSTSLIAQTVLPRKDVPIGIALGFLMQQLGGSVFVAVAQNIFTTALTRRLRGVSGLDVRPIVDGGATELRSVVPEGKLAAVLDIYSHALTRTFLLAAALSAASFFAATVVEWRSIKKGKGLPGASKTGKDEAEKGLAR